MLRRNPSKLPSLLSSLLSRHVSGTAKGKAKLKSGQALKRSSIPKKKPSSSSSSSSPNRPADRLDRLVDACLAAPTPVRHLTAKQLSREAEREKLGLPSKNKPSEKSPNQDQALMGTPGFDLISLGLVDAAAVPRYELTVADGRRLAAEYSRVLMRRHRARQAAETGLLRMKNEAVAALPEKLRGAAVVPDLTPFPAGRFMATLTPPIEGYVEQVREAARSYVGKEKLR